MTGLHRAKSSEKLPIGMNEKTILHNGVQFNSKSRGQTTPCKRKPGKTQLPGKLLISNYPGQLVINNGDTQWPKSMPSCLRNCWVRSVRCATWHSQRLRISHQPHVRTAADAGNYSGLSLSAKYHSSGLHPTSFSTLAIFSCDTNSASRNTLISSNIASHIFL